MVVLLLLEMDGMVGGCFNRIWSGWWEVVLAVHEVDGLSYRLF